VQVIAHCRHEPALTSLGQCAFQTQSSPAGRSYTSRFSQSHNTGRAINLPVHTRHTRRYESLPVTTNSSLDIVSGCTTHVSPIHHEHLARLPLLRRLCAPPHSTFGNITTATSKNISPHSQLRTTTLSLFIQLAGMEQLLQHESHPATAVHRGSCLSDMDSVQVNDSGVTVLSADHDDGSQVALDQTVSIGMLAHKFVTNVKVRTPLSFYQRLRTWRIATFRF
jgi:hypothetical protein